MNIIDDLLETYVYNGSISTKAIEDDIISLESVIDNYRVMYRELRLKGKDDFTLPFKIRNANDRLSILKLALKKAKDTTKETDDALLGVLGESGKEAKDTAMPDTATKGRNPKPQDFVSVDEVFKHFDSDETQEAVVEESDQVQEVVVEKSEYSDDIVRGLEDETEGDSVVNTENPKKDDEHPIVRLYEGCSVSIDKENGVVELGGNSTPSHGDYFIPKKEVEEVDSITYTGEACEILNDDKNKDFECPPPTINDYFEPIDNGDDRIYWMDSYTDEDTCPVKKEIEQNLQGEEIARPEPFECDKEFRNSVPFQNIVQQEDVSISLDCPVENGLASDCFQIYEPFPKSPDREIYASFDLSQYTDMVNTESVAGYFDTKKKLLEVTFYDPRDYAIFVKLLKDRKPRLLRFLEKSESIFMNVHKRCGDEESIYRYEFVGCRLKELFDTKYSPKNDVDKTYTVSHECSAVFTYKKLKVE